MDELPPEQIAILRKAFESFDREKTGSISTETVAEILRLMGQPFNQQILEEMIEEVDEDKSGRLEFEEFIILCAKFIIEEDSDALAKELKEAFRLYDKEGNGFIPTSCLKEILQELDNQLSDSDLDGMIAEIDTDGSGTVDFDEFMEMMTILLCAHVMSLNYTERCDFITKTAECHINRHFVDYLDFVFCTIGNRSANEYWGGVIVVGIICFYLFVTLAMTADKFFCPVLAVISKLLGLSENLAGVTLLAFGNGSPDIFTSLSNISRDDTELMYTQLIGGATFVTGFVIGIIMIIRPCHIPSQTYTRDVLFLLAAVIFISNSTHDQGYTIIEGFITVGFYFLYLATVIIDHFYMKLQIQKIRENAKDEMDEKLEQKMEDLESICDFQIRDRRDSSIVNSLHMGINLEMLTTRPNKNLMRKFLQDISPISKESWINSNWFHRIFMILKVPVQVCLCLIIPIVDYSEELHGWSKLLNMINVIILPQALLLSTHQSNTEILPFLPLWSIVLVISISLVVAIFVTTRNDCPPKWHIAFAAGSFAGSILVIYNVAKEVVSVMTAVGIISDMSDSFVGLSILAWGTSIGDAFSNIALARQGYQQMAFAACFGGPMFNALLGIGLPFIWKSFKSKENLAIIREGAMGPNCIVFLCVILSFQLLAMMFTKFQARKSIGVFCLIMYGTFLFYCLLGELEVIHPYGTDHHRT